MLMIGNMPSRQSLSTAKLWPSQIVSKDYGVE